MKKAVKISLLAIISAFVAPLILLIIIVLCLVVSALNVYYIHRPSIIGQTDYAFSDNIGQVYFSRNGECYKYAEDNSFERAFRNGYDSPFCVKAVSNDDYIFICYREGNNGPFFINVLDKDLNLLEKKFIDNSYRVIDMEESNNCIYYIAKNKSTGEANLEAIDVLTDNKRILLQDIKGKAVYVDNDTTICVDLRTILVPGFCLAVSREKTQLLNRWFCNVEAKLTKDEIEIEINDISYSFPNEYGCNKFYDKIYLEESKLLFAGYQDIARKQCGVIDDQYLCICRLGKSCLFSFDLNTKELSLIKNFEAGTFLIEYDIDNVEYYLNGCLYHNDSAIRTCEVIKEGKVEKVHFQKYFSPGDEKEKYYLSYYNGQFYGI